MAETDAPVQHGMLPGSHEGPRTPECRCGADWDWWNDQCVTGSREAESHAEAPWEVGDPDPTPADPGERCNVDCAPVGVCTWPTGHRGRHVSGTGRSVVGVAENDEEARNA